MPLWNALCFIFLITGIGMNTIASASVKSKPLVLQWEVSHSRNVDQISIIFRNRQVELVTNTSIFQKSKNIQLGRFKAPLSAEWDLKKTWINQYYMQLKKSVSLLDWIVKDSTHSLALSSKVDPHAPILRINEEKIHHQSTYFKLPFKIIQKVWDHKWTCVQCATYKKSKNHIVQTVTTLQKESSQKKGLKWNARSQRVPKKIFHCITKESGTVECVDPQFGIFEL